MNDPNTLASKQIAKIISEAFGRPLPDHARRRVEEVLSALTSSNTSATGANGFARHNVTILFADLRGFTSISASYPAGKVIELLNRCLVKMSQLIVGHGGVIANFMGDAIMAVFFGGEGAGEEAKRAVTCALEMQLAMRDLNTTHLGLGLPELYMGIGVNTGEVMAGTMGSELYSAYTVIGDEVNLASRIEAFSLRGQILISEATFGYCVDFVTASEPMEVFVKGREARVRLRELQAIPSLGKVVPRQEIRRSPRLEVRLPVLYQLVRDKIVVPEQHTGTILDIGYHGVLSEMASELPLYSEIKLDIDLPLVGYRMTDVYARIVKVRRHGGRHHAGIEFTSLAAEASSKLQLFVQMLIQRAS